MASRSLLLSQRLPLARLGPWASVPRVSPTMIGVPRRSGLSWIPRPFSAGSQHSDTVEQPSLVQSLNVEKQPTQNYFSFGIAGTGARELNTFLGRSGVKRPFFVLDDLTEDSTWEDLIQREFRPLPHGPKYDSSRWRVSASNNAGSGLEVSLQETQEALQDFLRWDHDGIVAVGGPLACSFAKALTALAHPGVQAKQFSDIATAVRGLKSGDLAPIITVPVTLQPLDQLDFAISIRDAETGEGIRIDGPALAPIAATFVPQLMDRVSLEEVGEAVFATLASAFDIAVSEGSSAVARAGAVAAALDVYHGLPVVSRALRPVPLGRNFLQQNHLGLGFDPAARVRSAYRAISRASEQIARATANSPIGLATALAESLARHLGVPLGRARAVVSLGTVWWNTAHGDHQTRIRYLELSSLMQTPRRRLPRDLVAKFNARDVHELREVGNEEALEGSGSSVSPLAEEEPVDPEILDHRLRDFLQHLSDIAETMKIPSLQDLGLTEEEWEERIPSIARTTVEILGSERGSQAAGSRLPDESEVTQLLRQLFYAPARPAEAIWTHGVGLNLRRLDSILRTALWTVWGQPIQPLEREFLPPLPEFRERQLLPEFPRRELLLGPLIRIPVPRSFPSELSFVRGIPRSQLHRFPTPWLEGLPRYSPTPLRRRVFWLTVLALSGILLSGVELSELVSYSRR